MKLRVKVALFALSTGLVALGTGTCFFRLLGDLAGDTLVLRTLQ
jgi:hypothetical protein